MTLHTARQVNTQNTNESETLSFIRSICCNPVHAMVTARVGPSVPRQERPARDGARVASIETGLAAAAAKLSHQVVSR